MSKGYANKISWIDLKYASLTAEIYVGNAVRNVKMVSLNAKFPILNNKILDVFHSVTGNILRQKTRQ